MSFVIGFNCSGASLLTSVLQGLCDYTDNLSFSLTPCLDGGIEESCQGLELSNLNSQLLESVGHNWDSPWLAAPGFKDCISNVDSLAVEQFLETHPTGCGHRWIDNDPRLCLTVDMVNQITNVSLPSIGIIRNPLEATHSLSTLTGISPDHAIGLWIIYNYHAFLANSSLPIALIAYEHLLDGAGGAVNQIAAFLGEHRPDRSSFETNTIHAELENVISCHHEVLHYQLLPDFETSYLERDCQLADAAMSMWTALRLSTSGTYLPTAEIRSAASNALLLVLTHYNSIFPSTFYSCHAALTASWKFSQEDRWKLLRRNEELSTQLESAASIHNHSIGDLDTSFIIRDLQSDILDATLKRESLVQKVDWLRRSLESVTALLALSNKNNRSLQNRISQLLSL